MVLAISSVKLKDKKGKNLPNLRFPTSLQSFLPLGDARCTKTKCWKQCTGWWTNR